jgi:hypothetical protein
LECSLQRSCTRWIFYKYCDGKGSRRMKFIDGPGLNDWKTAQKFVAGLGLNDWKTVLGLGKKVMLEVCYPN